MKFKQILTNLPGQPRGIFVTSRGFQKGAKEFAKKNDIKIYELRKPIDKDWEGRLKTINYTFKFFIPNFDNLEIITNKEWVKLEENKLNNIGYQIPDYVDITGETVLYDKNGKEISLLYKILDSYAQRKELNPTHKAHTFNQEVFINTKIKEFPKLKINSINFTISIRKITQKATSNAENIVGFILKDILDDNEYVFDKKKKLMHEKRIH